MKTIKGFKGFDKDLKCRGFQYKIGETYKTTNPIEVCHSGFHFCENPLDIFGYYNPGESKFTEIEGFGKEQRHSEDSKICVSKIKIGVEVSLKSIVENGIKFMFERVKWNKGNSTTGGRSGSQATGYRSGSQATGDRSGSQATGDRSMSSVNGNYSSSAIINTEDIISKEAVAMAIGYKNKVKAPLNCWLVIAERDENYKILYIKTAKVDGKKIKAHTWYELINGKFIKSE
jgi:hypothetical protein